MSEKWVMWRVGKVKETAELIFYFLMVLTHEACVILAEFAAITFNIEYSISQLNPAVYI